VSFQWCLEELENTTKKPYCSASYRELSVVGRHLSAAE
jgi:hypothetical protein